VKIIVAALAAGAAMSALAMTSPAEAFGMRSDGRNGVGVIWLIVNNNYDRDIDVYLDVLRREGMESVPEDIWRSDVEGDVFSLAPGEERRVAVQIRPVGVELLACAYRLGGINTRACAPVTRRLP